jgi:vancomycin aglycone glucosyltransferase
MKVVLAPLGTRGDVQPMIGLGVALQRAGHAVTLCAAENYADWIRSFGLPYCRGGRDAEALIRERGESMENPIAVLRGARDVIDEPFPLLRTACEGADLLIGTVLLTLGPSVAEALGIPFYWAAYAPQALPTAELPPPLGFPVWRRPWLNRLTWAVMGALSNAVGRKVVNRRRAELGLPAIADVYRHMQASPVLFAADAALATPPRDWPSLCQPTGAWLLEQSTPLPAEVERFIAAGAPPVYIGFGSMPVADPIARTGAIIAAVKASGSRALISRGWAGLGESRGVPDSCLLVGALSHELLFPKLAAVVHHGGAGTTTLAARAGVPQVIVPHLFDQPYWGARMHELGVSPPPLRKNFKADALAGALRQATGDPGLASAARALGERLGSTNGAVTAAQFLTDQHGGRG